MRGGPLARAAFFVFFAAVLTLAGCAGRFESFPFLLSDGTAIGMRESPGAGKEKEGLLESRKSGGSTPVYRLVKPAEISKGSESLALLYRSNLKDCLLTVYSAENRIMTEVSIPDTGEYAYRVLIPLAEGSRIWGFKLSTQSASGALKMIAAGTAPRERGFSVSGAEITLDGSVMIRSMDPGSLHALFSPAAFMAGSSSSWTLTVDIAPPHAEEELVAVFFSAEDSHPPKLFTLTPDAGLRRFVFSSGTVGFLPQEIKIACKNDGGAGALLVDSVRIGSSADGAPVPADPGTVLRYSSRYWRNPDYEVFSWTRFPGVLIFDTADYDVQDDLFKRLAFFVEKPGYAGTIPEPEELEGKHGWNAHDYKADDLARFFDTAMKHGIPLTPGEEELKKLLLARGIVARGEGGYFGGEGAVLSISRQSGDALRRQLITHECFHGVFFSVSGFREACAKAWSALTAIEREVWLLFFQTGTYDTSNQYLVINEFQAYLFQQPREKVGELQAIVVGRLRAKFPGKSAMLGRFMAEHPDSFLRSFDALDEALRRSGGPPGGKAIAVD